MKRKKKKGRIILALILVITEIVAFGAGYILGRKGIPKKDSLQAQPVSKQISADDSIDEIIETMTLEEMVYQMMFVTPESITGVGTVVRAGDATKTALQNYPVGGIVYFAANFETPEQTAEMIKNTQGYSKIPMFIGVDEEGGRVARLGNNSQMGTTLHPPMREIGDSGDAEKAKEVGKILANDLSKFGFNVDFAPVADVIIDENNTEIGDRSFGNNPDTVSLMVENVVAGLQEGGISATLKHFPGHGSTINNSHTGVSESARTIEQLRENEFLPFAAGINAGADFVMISHMTLTAATKEKVPSSLSKEVITDMLRGELGFNGIVITDAFNMGAVTTMYSQAEAAKMAINAGVDMILMPQSLTEVHSAIVSAVENGEISEERIKESVKRILTVKRKRGIC